MTLFEDVLYWTGMVRLTKSMRLELNNI